VIERIEDIGETSFAHDAMKWRMGSYDWVILWISHIRKSAAKQPITFMKA
jgi:hypothetical protein